jgi:micrococcal nuclease
MRKKLIAIFVAVSILLFSVYFISGKFASEKFSKQTKVTVAKVIDGDTIELANGKKVRLLGIDAPENGQKYYEEAKKKLAELVEGKEVMLESDVTNADKSGRLLRYVFANDVFVNLELVKLGLANVYIVLPDAKYSKQLLEAEEFARERGIGIWRRFSLPYSNCMQIVKFNYDAKGKDDENLNDEYVTFKNVCDFPINLSGWTVKDRSFNIFTFPEFTIQPSREVTLYSGSGKNTNSEIFWNSKYAIWNNDGDALYLRDREGNLILFKSYPPL